MTYGIAWGHEAERVAYEKAHSECVRILRVRPEMNRCFSRPCETPGEELHAGDEEPSLGGNNHCLEVFCQPSVAI